MFRFIWSWLIYTWGGLHRYFGNQNKIRSEHEHAIHYFARAYEVDPNFLQARIARAVLLYRELDRAQDALDEFDAILQDDPHCGPAFVQSGDGPAKKLGHFQASLTDFEAYLQLPQQNPPDSADAQRMIPLLQDLLAE